MSKEKSQVVLVDKSRTGKRRDWALHKIHNQYISLAYEEVDPKKSDRMKTCAQWLSFVKQDNGRLKLHDARFCRVRLCPICQWRRSLKTFAQMSRVLDIASADGYQFIFLTLTMKNCSASALSENLTHLLQSFRRLIGYKAFEKAVKGFYRGCEVTHNVRTDEYHPHLHVILAVNKSYFNGKTYISHEKWTQFWQRALQVDYTPIVDIRKCKGGARVTAEACKYAVKPEDIINFNDWDMTVDTLRVLDKALENRRFIGLGGILKDIHKSLHLDDMEEGDLVHVESEAQSEATPEEIVYFWNGYSQYER